MGRPQAPASSASDSPGQHPPLDGGDGLLLDHNRDTAACPPRLQPGPEPGFHRPARGLAALRAAFTARSLAYSFLGWPACPRTQVNWSRGTAAAATRACQSSRFSIGPAFRFQPRATPVREPIRESPEPGTPSPTRSGRGGGALPGHQLEAAMAPGERHLVVGGVRPAQVEITLDEGRCRHGPRSAPPRRRAWRLPARCQGRTRPGGRWRSAGSPGDRAHRSLLQDVEALECRRARTPSVSPVIGIRPTRTSSRPKDFEAVRHDHVLAPPPVEDHPACRLRPRLELRSSGRDSSGTSHPSPGRRCTRRPGSAMTRPMIAAAGLAAGPKRREHRRRPVGDTDEEEAPRCLRVGAPAAPPRSGRRPIRPPPPRGSAGCHPARRRPRQRRAPREQQRIDPNDRAHACWPAGYCQGGRAGRSR